MRDKCWPHHGWAYWRNEGKKDTVSATIDLKNDGMTADMFELWNYFSTTVVN